VTPSRLRAVLRSDVTVVTVLLVTAATLLVAFGLKAYCLSGWEPGHQPKTCYNDIQTLWFQRDMAEHRAPYSGDVVTTHRDGHLVEVTLGAGQIEYPVVTGVFAWAAALPATGHASYLVITAIALSPFAFVTSLALFRISRRRALLFAASPQLAAYAYLNWDLLPVAATALGLWAWYRQRVALAAVAFSLGACAKIYPGFLLLPLVIHLLLARRFRTAVTAVSAAVGAALAVNLPFLITNADGWMAPYLMQSVRRNDVTTNSVWFRILDAADVATVNRVSAAAVLLGWAAILGYGWRLSRTAGAYPWVQVGAAMVTGYIVLGRVDSPQYGLWLLPFLAVVAVPPRWIAIFMVTDIWLWLQWSWLWSSPDWMLAGATAARGLALVGLTVVLLRSPLADGHRPGDLRRADSPVASSQSRTAPVTSGAS
jgi:uncharacterized membrane protein